jgi:hypothetical protein
LLFSQEQKESFSQSILDLSRQAIECMVSWNDIRKENESKLHNDALFYDLYQAANTMNDHLMESITALRKEQRQGQR